MCTFKVIRVFTTLFSLFSVSCYQDDDCKSVPRDFSTPCVDITCYHGSCFKYGILEEGFCKCDTGWDGQECDICCDIDCDFGYKCMAIYEPTSDEYIRSCYEENRDSRGLNETDSLPFHQGIDDTGIVNNAEGEICKSARRESTDTCQGRVCYNGNCVSHEENLGFIVIKRPVCKCDPGWDGIHCDKCCDLECHSGICEIDVSNGEKKCTGGMDDTLTIVTTAQTPIHTNINIMTDSPAPLNNNSDCKDAMGSITPTMCSHGNSYCYHGKCLENVDMSTSLSPSSDHWCECDIGWVGNHCDECCNLLCQEGFTCKIKVNTPNCVPIENFISQPSEETQTSSTAILYSGPPLQDDSLDRNLETLTTPLGFLDDTTVAETSVNDGCTSIQRDGSTFCLSELCYNGNCNITEGVFIESFGSHIPTAVCVCDQGWVGSFCDICCDLDCHNGTCYWSFGESRMRCVCFPGYTGDWCEEEIPPTTLALLVINHDKTPTWYWYVIGAGIAIVLSLLVTMVAAPYYLWRKRTLFIMKIVHYFQTSEDESDGKIYDAVLSYSENCRSDEAFGVYQIYPKLEKALNYKLYLPFRDTPPGHVRAERIIWAAERSRRTILLISPEYLEDEWPRFEFLTALHETLSLRHQIIPIILRDISHIQNMDPVLKSLMKSLKCIKWPKEDDPKKVEKFWKLLELYMPKRKCVGEKGGFWRQMKLGNLLPKKKTYTGDVTSV